MGIANTFCRRPQFRGGIGERDHYLEILGLFRACSALAGGNTGGAQNGLVADFGHRSREDPAWQGIHRHLNQLPHGHIHYVGFIHLNFSGDDRHIGQRHQRAAG